MKIHGNRWLGLIEFKISKKYLIMNDWEQINYLRWTILEDNF